MCVHGRREVITLDAIFKRRSIRKFKNDPIPKEWTERILRAGMAAPTAGDSREWEFILFEDAAKKERFNELSEYAFALKSAPLGIVVCADLSREVHPGEGWWIQDMSAVIQNMLLEATELGLGSIWLGVYPREVRVNGVKEMFSLPEHVMPLGIIALGYAAKEKDATDRYLEERVHWESYQNPYGDK